LNLKAGIALATLSLSFSSFAQTELYVQDLNFMPKAGVFAYDGNISTSKSTSEREIYDPGSLINYDAENSEQTTDHVLGYGISDRFAAFLETSYVLNSETEINNVEVNGAGRTMPGTAKDSGLHYIGAGVNWRFLEQNKDSINADFRLSYSSGLQDAERGGFYDSNNDGNNDKASTGNSAQISPDFTIALAGGKKLEQFEVRGLIGLQVSSSGKYKAIKGNTDGSDVSVDRDSVAAFIYQLSGQLKLTERFFLYGSVTQTVISDIKENYTDANGDKNEAEYRANINLGLDLGAKVALVPNKFFVYGELHGDASPEQKVVTKTNGVIDNFRNQVKSSTTGKVTVGILASF
jgi:hypothetical protein